MEEQEIIELLDNASRQLSKEDYIDLLLNVKSEIDSRLDAIGDD